jgi:hypothetical protein
LCVCVSCICPYQTGKGYPKQTPEDVIEKKYTATSKLDDSYIECVIGKDFHKYKFINKPSMFVSYGKWLAEPRESAPFFEDKIIIRQTSDSLICNYDDENRINLNNVYNVGKKDLNFDLKYILTLLNSKLFNYFYQNISQEKGRLFAEVKKVNLAKLPVKNIPKDAQKPFIVKASSMILLNKEMHSLNNKFTTYFCGQYKIEKLNNKLELWYNLEFTNFITELNKSIKTFKGLPLTKKDEFDWIDLFEENKQKALELKSKIDATDKEIDKMVYKLYDLTEEEIKIVEG